LRQKIVGYKKRNLQQGEARLKKERNRKERKKDIEVGGQRWLLSLSIGKSLPDFKNLKKKSTNQKSPDFCQMFVISKKKYPRVLFKKTVKNLFPSLRIFILCVFHLWRII
jgi:hypothetical protein